jgi:hypothetical protein
MEGAETPIFAAISVIVGRPFGARLFRDPSGDMRRVLVLIFETPEETVAVPGVNRRGSQFSCFGLTSFKTLDMVSANNEYYTKRFAIVFENSYGSYEDNPPPAQLSNRTRRTERVRRRPFLSQQLRL